MMKVNLGCGMKPLHGYWNVDAAQTPGVQEVWDVDVHPWPWTDLSRIEAHHLFEHVLDPLGFMEQAWHALAPGGTLLIEVPYYTSRNAFTDPTHRRYCTEETFDYWVPTSWLWNMGGVTYHRNCPFRHVRPPAFNLDLSVELEKM